MYFLFLDSQIYVKSNSCYAAFNDVATRSQIASSATRVIHVKVDMKVNEAYGTSQEI